MTSSIPKELVGMAHQTDAITAVGFRLTFTQGFLAGQLSVIIIALLVIRYVIFEDTRSAPRSTQRPTAMPIRPTKGSNGVMSTAAAAASASKEGHRAPFGNDEDVARIMADILRKLRYEMDSHASEPVDWVNVLIAQALAGYRQDILAGGWSAAEQHTAAAPTDPTAHPNGSAEVVGLQRTARVWMEEILNANTVGRGMSFLDPIQVTQVEFGEAYPVLSNAKVRPADDMGRMRIELDIDYADAMSLAIETKLLINFPRPRFAVLPISMGLAIERFSGTLAIELFSNTPGLATALPKAIHGDGLPRSRHELHVSLHPDFTLDAHASSLVGSRAKLQDLPKIEQLLIGRVRTYIHERFVWPRYWSLTLPNLVPRHAEKDASSNRRVDDAQGHERDGMQVDGPGDARMDERRASRPPLDARSSDRGLFFETAPPLFAGIGPHTPQPIDEDGVPGSLPSVEAWRHMAASSGNEAAPSHGGHASPSLYRTALRQRPVNGMAR